MAFFHFTTARLRTLACVYFQYPHVHLQLSFSQLPSSFFFYSHCTFPLYQKATLTVVTDLFRVHYRMNVICTLCVWSFSSACSSGCFLTSDIAFIFQLCALVFKFVQILRTFFSQLSAVFQYLFSIDGVSVCQY